MYIRHVSFSKGSCLWKQRWKVTIRNLSCMAETLLLIVEIQHHSKELKKSFPSVAIFNTTKTLASRINHLPCHCWMIALEDFGRATPLFYAENYIPISWPDLIILPPAWTFLKNDNHTKEPERGTCYWLFVCRTISIIPIAEDDPILETNLLKHDRKIGPPCGFRFTCALLSLLAPVSRKYRKMLTWPYCAARMAAVQPSWKVSWRVRGFSGGGGETWGPLTVFSLNKCQITVIQWSPLKQCHPSSPWSIHKPFANQPWGCWLAFTNSLKQKLILGSQNPLAWSNVLFLFVSLAGKKTPF